MFGKEYRNCTMELEAYNFARVAHAAVGQKRKYTGEDYIVHPAEVANLVRGIGGSSEMIQAAYLHDVVEDTKITVNEISEYFGEEVGSLVHALTDIYSDPIWGNREKRKELERNRIARIDPKAQTIKLADLISNTQSIVEYDPDFAKIYLREKAEILKVMTLGDSRLYAIAWVTLNDGLQKIGEEI